MSAENLKIELDKAVNRIETLELQLKTANSSIADLSRCVKNITLATQSLSSEMMAIAEIIQQATHQSQKSSDYFTWRSDSDDDGYIN